MNTIEAAHQDALMQAVFRRSDEVIGAASTIAEGLSNYRNNGSLNASRAMSLMFPTVFKLLGEDDFYPMAKRHWLAQPPQRGDWSQYGEGFGNWLAAHNPGGVVDALPFLPDLARLDDALSRCQDAPDAITDLSSLALLEQDPATLRMVLHPSVAVLTLHHGVLAFRAAVLNDQPLIEPLRQTTHALIARDGWRAKVQAIDAGGAALIRNVLSGATLLQAHDAATAIDPAFDVSAWLAQAIPAQWLVRVETI
jgi:hypothetical protein